MCFIFSFLIVISVLYGIYTGNAPALSAAVINGAFSAVELFITLLAAMCFWSGIMEVAKQSGVTGLISRMLAPFTRRLFRDVDPKSSAMHEISMNITANMLGLGNAATPSGIRAMKELEKLSSDKKTATDSMIKFVVINTASMQLIPSTVAAVRLAAGSVSPFDIVPAVWLSSGISLACAIIMACLICRAEKRPRKC